MRQILAYLKRSHIADTRTVNRLFVSAFLSVSQLKVREESFLGRYVVDEAEDNAKHLRWILKRVQDKKIQLDLETLISLFEFVISPSDRVVTGAIYTPKPIRSRIIDEVLGDVPFDSLARSTVADISCGCGGFLMDATLQIHQKTGRTFAEIYRDNIFGIDIEGYSIERTRIVLTLLALMHGEDGDFEFNLMQEDTLIWRSDEFDERYRHFDFVVGNPPYVCSRNMTDETRSKALTFEVCHYGHPDLYIPFIQIAIESLNAGGRLGFITMNSFFNSQNGRGLREYLVDKSLQMRVVDFRGYQVFKSKSTYTCLLFVGSVNSDNVQYACVEDCHFNEALRFNNVPYVELDAERGWSLRGTVRVAEVENIGTPLGRYCNSRHGIATLSNKTYIFRPVASDADFFVLEKEGVHYPIERGICRDIVNSNKLNSDVDFDSLVEKVIFPYRIDEADKAVVYSETEMQAQFPMALAYLRSQRGELAKRDKGHTEDYPMWYAYGRTQSLVMPRYKLFFPKIANKALQCVLTDNPQMMLYNGMAFVSDNLQRLSVLKCYMESDLFWDYVSANAKPYASGFYSLNGVNIKKFGIPDLSETQTAELLAKTSSDERNEFIRRMYEE